MAPVAAEKDEVRQALKFGTYTLIFKGRALGLLGRAGLTAEQLSREAAARQTLNTQIAEIDKGVDAGTFQKDAHGALVKALADYNAQPGDPTRDRVKGDLAREVLRAAEHYVFLELLEKYKAAGTYMDTIEKTLSSDQKDSLVAAYRAATQPAPARSRPAATVPGGQ